MTSSRSGWAAGSGEGLSVTAAGWTGTRTVNSAPLPGPAVAVGRGPHQVGQVEVLALQLDLAAGDPGHVEQVVDEPGEAADLAVQQVAGPGARLLVAAPQPEDVQGVADGRQGVAQLVGEH